jgi:hypothetical protein
MAEIVANDPTAADEPGIVLEHPVQDPRLLLSGSMLLTSQQGTLTK